MKHGLQELQTMMHITATDKLSVTLDKGKKNLDIFGTLKIPPPQTQVWSLKKRTCPEKPGHMVTLF